MQEKTKTVISRIEKQYYRKGVDYNKFEKNGKGIVIYKRCVRIEFIIIWNYSEYLNAYIICNGVNIFEI